MLRFRGPTFTTLRTTVAALAALPLLGACAGPDAGRDDAVVRDSAGITIVEHEPADSASLRWIELSPDPLVIGATAGQAGVELFQVRDAERFPDGGIVVANGGSAELLFFDAAGEHVATGGRRGGGPGEFQQITSLVLLPGDSVLVFDLQSNRASLFDRSGTFVRDFVPSADPRVSLIGRFADGSFAGTLPARLEMEGLQNGLTVRDIVHVRYQPPGQTASAEGSADEGARIDTLDIGPGSQMVLRMTQHGGEIRSIELLRPPFGRTTGTAVADDAVYIGTQIGAEIRVVDRSGRLVRLIRTGGAEAPVTPELKEAWIERQTASVPPDRQTATRRVYSEIEFPPTVPAYGGILAARDGTLWIQDYTGTGASNDWTVHGPDGRRRARIRLPERFRAFGVGDDWVLGVERDDLDVEQVRLYRLTSTP